MVAKIALKRLRFAIAVSIWLVSLIGTAVFAANPPQPTNMAVFHRSGQTFITWTERLAIAGEQYRIYRHTHPIMATNVSQAARVAQVAEGSGRFFADRYNVESSGVWSGRYVDRFVLHDMAGQIPGGTGLLVWTLAEADFGTGSRGTGYYAVTTVNAAGIENVTDFSRGNASGPVVEGVADPLPVEIARGGGGRGHVFIQYMDLRKWNPTFHAPNQSNVYYGLDSSDPGVRNSVQYAYTYSVGEPDPANCPSPLPARFPVILNLHGWADNSYGPDTGASQYYCAFEVRPIDVSETWWFGFARNHDYREGNAVQPGDVVVNYTEWRVLRMIHDLLRSSVFGPKIDQNRLYVYGHSMGGSGTLALTLRYPNVFAAAYASEPMTNYRTSTMWEDDVALKWGAQSLNLPVQIEGPGTWAANLARYNGGGVWDWQNHRVNVTSRAGDQFVPFGVAHGRNDHTIEWTTQGRPAYGAFDTSRQAWGGVVNDADHTWQGFAGLPPNLALDGSYAPFAGLRAVRTETVPGLSGASGNSPIPPPGPGGPEDGYNQTIQWSASWQPWDGLPLDRVNEWRISLRTTDGSTQTVDVTPRRAQKFRTVAGRAYRWENRRVRNGALVASGIVSADAKGRLTVRDQQVTPGGNRVHITFGRPWPDTSRGVHVFNDQLPDGMPGKLLAFSATRYAGTQKMTRVEADRLRGVNPAFLILHYRLGHGLGYRAVQGDCQPIGDWLRIIVGNNWVREWPDAKVLKEGWLFHWPQSGGPRVLNCDWGWYLMELNNPGLRNYWQTAVLSQVRANDDDGVFMDSLSAPNYLGADRYRPPLPAVSAAFEAGWARRIKEWLVWLKGQDLGNYYLVPNVGSWITTRETTDYSAADGLMVEGFGLEADASPYAYADWRMQMDRILRAARRGQAVIGQTYVSGRRERLFALGSYLLVKGDRTFLNIELGPDPEWWPEYDIAIGAPVAKPAANIAALDPDGDAIYRRNFDNGFVLVNPTNPWDGSGVTRTVALGGTYYRAETTGGGIVPSSGIPTGSVSYRAVTSVTLPPYSAAVLLNAQPTVVRE